LIYFVLITSKPHGVVGLTINNLNKFVFRHFEDQVLSGLKPNPRSGSRTGFR